MTEQRPQLYLIAPPAGAPMRAQLEAALEAGDVACVLIRGSAALAEGDVVELVRIIQSHGAAALLDGDGVAANRAAADGVHVEGPAPLSGAIRQIKPAGIVGAGRLATRDDAMAAGEAGVDYVMLGDDPDVTFEDRLDRVAWWAEIFQVPCVALAQTVAEVTPLAETGAEFVGVGAAVWDDPDGPAAAIRKVEQAIATGHAAYLARQAEPA